DGRVMLFAFAVLLFSGLAMGIAPAWQVSRTDIKALLNAGGRTATSRLATSRLMSGMIVGAGPVAVARLARARRAGPSFSRRRSTDPGFSTHGRLVVDVRPTHLFADAASARTWADELLRRLRAVAGGNATIGLTVAYPLRRDLEGTTNVEMTGDAPDP